MNLRKYVQEWWNATLPEKAELVYFNTHADWSWSAVLLIYQLDNRLFIQEDSDNWNPYETNEDHALEAMIEFDEYRRGWV